MACSCGGFNLVIEINNAGVKRNYVAHLINKNLQCVFDIQGGSKCAGNFVKRVNLTMRILDLIISHVGAALPGLSHVDLSQLQRFVSKTGCRRLLQTKHGDLLFESGSMHEEHLDHIWIEMNSRPSQQQSGSLVDSHSTPERTIL